MRNALTVGLVIGTLTLVPGRWVRSGPDVRKRRLHSADIAKHLKARPARQVQIDDDAVVVDHPRLHACVVAVVEDVDGVALFFEALLEEARDSPVVFDDEDSHVL